MPTGTPASQPAILPEDDDVATILARAGWLGSLPEGGGTTPRTPLATYHGVFVAMLATRVTSARWVAEAAADAGVTVERVARRWAATGGPSVIRGVLDRVDTVTSPPCSSSVASVLATAIELARNSGDAAVEVDHLIAAYAFTPGHDDDLLEWGFDRREWAARAIARASSQAPHRLSSLLALHGNRLPTVLSCHAREALVWAMSLAAAHPRKVTAADLLGGIVLSATADSTGLTAPWLASVVGTDIQHLFGQPTPSRVAVTGELELGDVETDEEAADVLFRAAILAAANPEFHASHILGGILISGPTTADAVWQRARRTRQDMLGLLWERVEATEPGDFAQWRRVYRLGDELRRAGYSNDNAAGQDHLGFDRAARAMAAMISATDSSPPLSIGLFGDWGSGKSFFIHQVKHYVAEIADQARGSREINPAYCGHVVQIDFNAWQFMDSNLWASLTAHLFDELNRALTRQDKPTAGKYVQELASVKEEIAQLEKQRSEVAGKLSAVTTEIAKNEAARKQRIPSAADLAREVQREVLEDEQVKTAFATARKAFGFDESVQRLEDVRRELGALGSLAARVPVWWRMVASPATRGVTIAAIVILVAVPVIAYLASRVSLPGIGGVAAAVSWIAGILARTRKALEPIVGEIDRGVVKADELAVRLQSERSPQEAQLVAERERLAAEAVRLGEQRTGLAQREAAIGAQLEELRNGTSFVRYVLERAASDDYRKQQGIISMVRRDLEELAERLECKTDEPHVERIILYIDDLDRCSPRRVVEVLQAIHLLLSIRLFVVIVAVDSQWLLDSLEAYYARQFRIGNRRDRETDWEASPQRYLEKIFQVPFAIPGMASDGFKALIGSLIARETSAPRVVDPRVGASRIGDPIAVSPSAKLPSPAPVPRPASPAARRDDVTAHMFPTVIANAAIEPPVLLLSVDEREHLHGLGLLVPTPRAAKRLANLYRFARAALPPHLIPAFRQGGFKLAQVLLAIIVGKPLIGLEVIKNLLDHGGSKQKLLELLDDPVPPSRKPVPADPYWAPLREALRRLDLEDPRMTVDIARAMARFGFDTARLLRYPAEARPSPPDRAAATSELPAQA